GDVSAIAEVKARGIEVLSIITLYDLIEYLEEEQSVTQARVLREYASTC
ncbi:MAG: orotate phosphoribosyltransferase, partial [Gammaproteobacteria bacterium]|nr:orotate phosphoribosyltransferase [Gammaproteobacteria bacterium]